MTIGPVALSDIFAVCFWFGAATTVITFVLGIGHHASLHLPHLGHLGHVGAHGADANGVSPFNLTSILAFLVVFGAVGMALPGGVGGLLALLLAALAGLVAGWIAFSFITRFLLRGETYLVDEPLVGTVGAVSIPIGSGHVGEIMYTRHGVRRSDGARSIDGKPIGEGEQVVIVSYQKGLATVQRWEEFLEGNQAPPRVSRGS